jgi:hypothetical protein
VPAHVQKLVSLVKITAVSCAFFFMGKRAQCKRYLQDIFPVYGGKCLSRKAVHNWIEKFSHRRSKFADRPAEISTEATVQRGCLPYFGILREYC